VDSAGLGGEGPANALTLTLASVLAPPRHRNLIVTGTACCQPAGAVISGLVGTALAGSFGWNSIFLLGGAAGLALLPFFALIRPDIAGLSRARVPGRPTKPGSGVAARPRFPLLLLMNDGRVAGTLPLAAGLVLRRCYCWATAAIGMSGLALALIFLAGFFGLGAVFCTPLAVVHYYPIRRNWAMRQWAMLRP